MFLRAFGSAPDADALLVAFGLVNVAAVIPILPGGLGTIDLGLSTCVYVKDVSTDKPLAKNACVKSVSMKAGAWSGHPLVYSETPW